MTPTLRAGALALAVSLAACAAPPAASPATGSASGPVTVPTARAAFDLACRNEPLAYAAYTLAASLRPVSARTRASVEAAHAEAERICSAPPADLVSAVVAVTRAYATVRVARDAATQKA